MTAYATGWRHVSHVTTWRIRKSSRAFPAEKSSTVGLTHAPSTVVLTQATSTVGLTHATSTVGLTNARKTKYRWFDPRGLYHACAVGLTHAPLVWPRRMREKSGTVGLTHATEPCQNRSLWRGLCPKLARNAALNRSSS